MICSLFSSTECVHSPYSPINPNEESPFRLAWRFTVGRSFTLPPCGFHIGVLAEDRLGVYPGCAHLEHMHTCLGRLKEEIQELSGCKHGINSEWRFWSRISLHTQSADKKQMPKCYFRGVLFVFQFYFKGSCFILGRLKTGELHTLTMQLREASQSKQFPFSHYKGFWILMKCDLGASDPSYCKDKVCFQGISPC